MKLKKLMALALALCCALSLFACAKKTQVREEAQEMPQDDWGLTLVLEFTDTGAQLVFTQSGGAPTGELQTGSYYVIERLEDGAWEEMPWRAGLAGENVAWTAEAWLIPAEDTVSFDMDWSFLYGELPAGEYRIGKEVMDFHAGGDYDQKMYYAEFAVID